MKHFFLWLALCAGLLGSAVPARAQLSGSDSLQAKLGSVFGNLDKTQIPTGYLFEAAPKFFDWRYYNGTLTDTSLTDLGVLRYLRLMSRAARLAGPAPDTLPDLHAYNARVSAASAASAAIPLSVQYFPYARIRPDALQNNLLTVQNEQLFDVPGRSQSPYQTAVLFAAAPERSFSASRAVALTLPNSPASKSHPS